MKSVFIALFFSTIVLFSLSCKTQNKTENAKYVFLFIGDGMGVNQVYATELYKASLDNKHGRQPLNFSTFPVQTRVTTYSANNLITCSAASGTAIATGYKTNNGVIGKDTSLTISYSSVAQKAKNSGYKVGIVSSVSIDHATPASFYAHQNSRSKYYEISMELPKSNFDYFGGGGFEYPKGRNDSLPDAFDNAIQNGYTLVNTEDAFSNLKQGDQKVLAINPKMYPKGEFYWAIDKVTGTISLADFTQKGIELIDNSKGFFMMVEGGKIDWACHGNDLASSIQETVEFEKAVQQAVNFYNLHPDETLILVTADHETGGLGLGNNKPLNLGILQHQKISMQEFQRLVTNQKLSNSNTSFDEVMAIIEQNFGLGNADKNLELSDADLLLIKDAFNLEFAKGNGIGSEYNYLKEDEAGAITTAVIALMSKKAGIGWTTNNHTGTPVPLYVMGVGQNSFKGQLDNTDISKTIARLMQVED